MRTLTAILAFIIILPAIFFTIQFYLCKKKSNFALIFPVITACFFVILGYYALIMTGIMFLIYFVMKHLDKLKEAKNSEIKKMNIEDL